MPDGACSHDPTDPVTELAAFIEAVAIRRTAVRRIALTMARGTALLVESGSPVADGLPWTGTGPGMRAENESSALTSRGWICSACLPTPREPCSSSAHYGYPWSRSLRSPFLLDGTLGHVCAGGA